MAVTTTLGALAIAEPAIARLAAARLPVRTAYAVATLLRAVRAETTVYHEQRQAMVARWGQERDATPAEQASLGGDRVTVVMPAHYADFAAAMTELAAITVALPCLPLPLADLPDTSATDIDALWPFLAAGDAV